MNDPTISYAIPCEAIRVFCGFPNASLVEPQFFTQLGQTFMPGTPYMLQPMGLAAYLPGVLANAPAGLPHEFALICYASAQVWDTAMNHTLRGRVYNQTHGGVYAMPPSSASFPVLVDHLPLTATDPYFLWPRSIDWQTGVTHTAVAGKANASKSGEEFRADLRAAILGVRPALEKAGIDQAIVVARNEFAVLWFHAESGDDLPLALDFLGPVLSAPMVLRNERVLCTDEPPTLNITGSSAYNFIFLREAKYFLR